MSTGFKASIALNIILLIVLVVGLVVASNFYAKLQGTQGERHQRLTAEMASAVAASRLQQADAAFVGDSITAAGLWQEYFPAQRVINRGVPSDQTTDVMARLDDIVAMRPRKIFLMVGVNDLNFGASPAETAASYSALLRQIESRLPDSEIYIQSVLPVADDYVVPGMNAAIAELNLQLAGLAEEGGHTYIELGSHFSDDSGALAEELTPDGLHLAGEGYTRWRDLLGPYVEGE